MFFKYEATFSFGFIKQMYMFLMISLCFNVILQIFLTVER